MHSHAKASNGIMQDALVVSDENLRKIWLSFRRAIDDFF
jgi:hypothetical protein